MIPYEEEGKYIVYISLNHTISYPKEEKIQQNSVHRGKTKVSLAAFLSPFSLASGRERRTNGFQ